MMWKVSYTDEARKDLKQLDGSQKKSVGRTITKVQQNPLPRNEGGYGIPLGKKRNVDLTGYLEMKMRGDGMRIIYKLIRTETEMLIVIIGMREDDTVFDEAQDRINKHNL